MPSSRSIKGRKKLVILSHSAGITPSSISIEETLERWCNNIQSVLGMPHKKGNSQYFTQLIVRLQMKGYQPIILIDSLDSFLPSHILNRFHLLPDNIPWFLYITSGSNSSSLSTKDEIQSNEYRFSNRTRGTNGHHRSYEEEQ